MADRDDDAAPTLSNQTERIQVPSPVTRVPQTGVDPVRAQLARLATARFDERYATQTRLGSGGMGEVLACNDTRLGRSVAVKHLRREHHAKPELALRFEQEAKIQGRLEHPGVVPVYDLGLREDGTLYFTMKHVHGSTLEEIIGALSRKEPAAQERYSRRRLLTAFASVCQTLAYAHSRGVIHRDLKPGNVMLGEFGEVNVLDWGVAKVVGQGGAEGCRDSQANVPPITPVDLQSEAIPSTVVGAMVGTPGYMAPEQVRGENDRLDARADVYALGAILFEILTLEPLHPRRSLDEIIRATVRGSSNSSSSQRRPDLAIPPELDALCERATALCADDRYPSARELSAALERFLDGDRDVERRKELALEHVERAEAVLSGAAVGDDVEQRLSALRELNAALALDPTRSEALAMLARIVTDVPERLPAAAERELAFERARVRRRAARVAGVAILVAWLLVPMVWWMGPRDPRLGLPFVVLALATMLAVWRTGRTGQATRAHTLLTSVCAVGAAACTAVLLGPLVATPTLVLAVAVVLIVNSRADRALRSAISGLALAGLGIPILMQLVGWLPRSYSFEAGRLVVEPWATSFQPGPTLAFLTLFNCGILLLATSVLGRTVDALTRAERRQFAQGWQLRQIFPEQARVSERTPPRSA